MIRPLALAALLVPAAHAEPPAALAPALKPQVAAAARGAFRRVNEAYSIELTRLNVQRDIERQRTALLAERAAGLRERVIDETEEFLIMLSGEVDHLATQARDAGEYRARLSAISEHVLAWAGAAPASGPARPAAATALTPTEPDILGPYYRANAPFQTNLIPRGATGGRDTISGTVRAADGTAVAGALVEIWQADASGAYDIADPKDANDARIAHRFRGRMRTDAAGRYSYTTILPGNYEIGSGRWRPKHIHYKVSAPGYRTLITQLYFDGDPYNAVDPWWKQSNSIPLAGSGGASTGVYDIVLAR